MMIEKCHEVELGRIVFRPNLSIKYNVGNKPLDVPLFSLASEAMRETYVHVRNLENPSAEYYLTCQISYAMTVIKWVSAMEGCLAIVERLCSEYVDRKLSLTKAKMNFWERCERIIKFAKCGDDDFFEKNLKNDLKSIRGFRHRVIHSLMADFYERKNDRSQLFPENPYDSTIVDVITASRISIEFFHFFRYVIYPFDLMPSAPLVTSDSLVFSKMDVVYEKVLYPAFLAIMDKHHLGTMHNLQLKKINPLPYIGFCTWGCKPLIKGEYRASCGRLNYEKTDIFNQHVSKFVCEIGIKKDTIVLPDMFARRKSNCC